MKKVLVLLMLLLASAAHAGKPVVPPKPVPKPVAPPKPADRRIVEMNHAKLMFSSGDHPYAAEVKLMCIGGYKWTILDVTGSDSSPVMEQIMKPGQYGPTPIKCEE